MNETMKKVGYNALKTAAYTMMGAAALYSAAGLSPKSLSEPQVIPGTEYEMTVAYHNDTLEGFKVQGDEGAITVYAKRVENCADDSLDYAIMQEKEGIPEFENCESLTRIVKDIESGKYL